MQQEVELGQQERQRLGLAAPDGFLLQDAAFLDRVCLAFQMKERIGQEAAGAARRIQDGLAQLRVGDLNHEPHNRTGGVELA